MYAYAQPNQKKTQQTNRDRPTKQATQNSTHRRRPRRQPVRSLPSPALQSSSCRQASTSDICNIHTFSCHASHQHINRCTFSVRGTCEPQRSPGNLTEGAWNHWILKPASIISRPAAGDFSRTEERLVREPVHGQCLQQCYVSCMLRGIVKNSRRFRNQHLTVNYRDVIQKPEKTKQSVQLYVVNM